MFHIETSIIINRPAEEVFAFVADNENDPQWCVPVVDTTRIVGDAPGPNTRYSFGARAGLISARGEFDIVEFRPPEHIAWEGHSPFSRYKGSYTLTAVDEGTKLAFSVSFTTKTLYRLFESRFQNQFTKNYTEQFANLKTLLEGQNEGTG